MFVNRTEELARLQARYASQRAELFVLYGRRRVGKTELLREFCRDKAHIFFVATLSSDSDQLAAFSQMIWQYTHSEVDDAFTFPSWEAAFKALADLPGRPIVVIDEITYLIAGNKAIPSILQKVWDAQLSRSNIMLILCGSYIGMIERELLDYQAALYGRRSGSELLLPLELPAIAAFFPTSSPSQLIEIWAVLGGMPYYLSLFSHQHKLFNNIRTHILHPQGTLYNEPLLLLVEELREPRNYFSILRAIAAGHTRLNEIAQAAGVGDNSATARYLDILQQLRVVRRQVPVTEPQPEEQERHLPDRGCFSALLVSLRSPLPGVAGTGPYRRHLQPARAAGIRRLRRTGIGGSRPSLCCPAGAQRPTTLCAGAHWPLVAPRRRDRCGGDQCYRQGVAYR